ncbi:MAG: hypothetical protein J1E64_06755 [Acetatifactor sp.]|nr:hypothetical protein [Acetatifactor sp.]
MYQYSVIQWLFFFYFYSFFGWCFESTYVSVKSRHLTNRGFMRGPFLPLYGSGAIMMLVISMPFQDSLLLVYVAGFIGATVLEYITGVIMEKLFKVRYWDYSGKPFNFQGQICLGSSIAWGFLTILMTEVVHRPFEYLVLSVPGSVLTVVTCVLTAGIAGDFALSFKAALDLRDVLIRMERAKEELMRIHKRLDVIVAFTGEELSGYKEGVIVRMEDLRDGIEEKLERLKSMTQSKHTESLSDVKEEVHELDRKYASSVEERQQLGVLKDFFQRGLIRSNPTMSSKKYAEALEELKERLKR